MQITDYIIYGLSAVRTNFADFFQVFLVGRHFRALEFYFGLISRIVPFSEVGTISLLAIILRYLFNFSNNA